MKYLKSYESKIGKNTKIVFYWTTLNWEREYEKIIFQTVVKGDLDKNDAFNWDDENTSYIFDKFDFHEVLDHVIVLVEPTDEPVKDVEIIKKIRGKIVFEEDEEKIENDTQDYNHNDEPIKWAPNEPDELDELDQLKKDNKKLKKSIIKTKAKIYDLDRAKEKRQEKERKDYPSLWIDLSGNEYVVGFSGHNEFASEWLYKNGYSFDDIHSGHRYAYEILTEDEGWVRILGWTDPPTFSLPDKITPKQRKAIKDYCQSNECDLPKEL